MSIVQYCNDNKLWLLLPFRLCSYFKTLSILSKQPERLISIDYPVKRKRYRWYRYHLQEGCITLLCCTFSGKHDSLVGALYSRANAQKVWKKKKVCILQLNPLRTGMMFLPTHWQLHFLPWCLQDNSNEAGSGVLSTYAKVLPLGSSAPLHLSPEYTLDSFKIICSHLSSLTRQEPYYRA